MYFIIENTESKEDWHGSILCDALGVRALGMQSGAIQDSHIVASSSFNEQSVGPQYSRWVQWQYCRWVQW